jgi:Tfp pilus assembly protein PilO
MAKKKEKIKVEKKAKEKKPKKNLKEVFNQKTFGGITVAGVCVLVVIYMFVFLDYTDKTQELEDTNEVLSARVSELQEYSANIDLYRSEIEDMRTEIESILGEYPAGAREEDIIMLAVNMQKNNQIGYSAINMDDTEEVYDIPSDEVAAASMEGMDSELTFASKKATYAMTTTYNDLKSVLSEIFESDNRIGLDDITLSKNEEDGTLSGNLDLSFYSAYGTGREYEAPDISQYIAGTEDIFNSGKITTPASEEGEEGEEDGEENGEDTENSEKKGD